MTAPIVNDQVIGVRADDVYTINAAAGRFPPQALGTIVKLADGGRAILAKASAAITGEGYVCQIGEDHVATMITTTTSNGNNGIRVGVAQAALAINEIGWFVIAGKTQLRVSASAAAHVRLNTTATAGQVDDDATAGARAIDNVVLKVANGGAAGLVEAVIVGDAKIGVTI